MSDAISTRPASPPPASPVNILLVDDEERNLQVLESLLQTAEYRLVRASTANDALISLLEGEFAAIVLDIQMPGMSGIELANLIKQRKKTQHIPIIFLTAYFQEDKDVLEGYEIGAVDYLTKPINPQILKSKIAVFADLFRKTRALAESNAALEAEIAQRQKAEEALRNANNDLEARVHARTSDLVRVNDELRDRGKALRESESRVRLLADNMAQLAWMADPSGARIWFNQRWLDYTGGTLAEMTGWGWQRTQHPDHVERVLTKFKRHIKSGDEWEDTYPIRDKDGGYRWFLSRATPVRDEEGHVLRWFGTNTDITDLKATQEALRARETQLQLVTDNAPVYLVQCDREHRFTYVNRAYASRFKLEPKDVIGKTPDEVIGEPAYALIRPLIDETLSGKRVEAEIEIPYGPFGPRWVYTIQEPERTSTGDVVGVVAVITDITERKLVEVEMARARDKALAASRAKDDFLATLSHELRTPLNPVLLLASEAANNLALPAEVRADFDTIAKNVTLEARLIDDLLDLTRVSQGKLSLELRALDVHAILKNAIEMARAEIAQKRQTLLIKFEAPMAVVRGDDVRLQQIFWNVFKNAVKFTPEEGRISVETQASADNRRLVIRIVDSGHGLTDDEMGRIFEAFAQGDHAQAGSHRFGGMGLGLAISRRLAEVHGGTIRGMSAGRDQGATFEIELPLATGDGDASPRVEEADGAGTRFPLLPRVGSNGHRGRILLVEDHEPTRVALTRLLVRRRYDVVGAACVLEARAAAKSGSFDLLISDIGLPDGNGYELMNELRSHHGLKGIALTGYGMEQDIARSEAAGFIKHLIKPVRVQALDDALATAGQG